MNSKIGRNDPCSCGSGLKYKKCCMKNDKESEHKQREHKQLEHKLREEIEHDVDRKIYSSTFATKQEIMDSIRDDGFVPVVVNEGIRDGIHGKTTYVEIDEICKHGVSEKSQKFELNDGKWEYVETPCSMRYCSICEDLKTCQILCCPRCGEKMPDISEEECIRIYENDLFYSAQVPTTCPSCGAPWINISE